MKISVKEKLVDHMIANGNKFTYTQMIKTLLKLTKPNETYDWRTHRGYFSTNFTHGYVKGYMVNGGGICGVYKGEDGFWSARYFTKEEKKSRKVKMKLERMMRDLKTIERNRLIDLNNGYRINYNNDYNKIVNEYTKKISRIV